MWSVVGRNQFMQRVIVYPPERESVARARADECALESPVLVWSVEPWEEGQVITNPDKRGAEDGDPYPGDVA